MNEAGKENGPAALERKGEASQSILLRGYWYGKALQELTQSARPELLLNDYKIYDTSLSSGVSALVTVAEPEQQQPQQLTVAPVTQEGFLNWNHFKRESLRAYAPFLDDMKEESEGERAERQAEGRFSDQEVALFSEAAARLRHAMPEVHAFLSSLSIEDFTRKYSHTFPLLNFDEVMFLTGKVSLLWIINAS